MSTDPSALNSTSQRQPRSEVFDNHGAWPGVAKRVEDVSLIQPAQEVKKPSEDPAFGITMGSNICLLHGHNSRRDGASAHVAVRAVSRHDLAKGAGGDRQAFMVDEPSTVRHTRSTRGPPSYPASTASMPGIVPGCAARAAATIASRSARA